MKKLMKVLSVILLGIFLTACGSKEKTTATGEKKVEKKVIKLSTKFVEEEQSAKTLHIVANKINERLEGKVEIQEIGRAHV